MRILHLEDSSCDAELAKRLIRNEIPTSECTWVKTGRDFEEAVSQREFDIILSDYTIPGYSGLDALFFAQKHCPEKPFIYFSGGIGEERTIEALKFGAKDYVLKDRDGLLVPAIIAALAQAEHLP
jgi:DNA-binding NtrC family response regulator